MLFVAKSKMGQIAALRGPEKRHGRSLFVFVPLVCFLGQKALKENARFKQAGDRTCRSDGDTPSDHNDAPTQAVVLTLQQLAAEGGEEGGSAEERVAARKALQSQLAALAGLRAQVDTLQRDEGALQADWSATAEQRAVLQQLRDSNVRRLR